MTAQGAHPCPAAEQVSCDRSSGGPSWRWSNGRNTGREGLGVPRGAPRGGRARPPLHRPPPAARGDQPAGLRRAAPGRAPGAPHRPHPGHRGPQRPHHARPDHRPGQPHPGRDAAPQLRGVRRHALPDGRRRAGHRARRRPAARAHPAGHDHRLRRQPHLDARGVRRARVRHRHLRGRARARHPDPAAQAVQDDGDHRRRRAGRRRHRQGHRARGHRQDRHRWRPGLRARVPRQRHPRAVDGSPDDGVQHVDRGRRPRRHDRPRRDHLRVPARSRPRPDRRRVGRRGRGVEPPAHRRRRRVRRGGRARRRHAHAVRHLGHQPRVRAPRSAPPCPTPS